MNYFADVCNDCHLRWCCLGGILDECDASYTDCALRETEEEIGIGRERVEVWGETALVHLRETTAIMPVIGMIHDYNTELLKINDDEVERVFTVPIIGNWLTINWMRKWLELSNYAIIVGFRFVSDEKAYTVPCGATKCRKNKQHTWCWR